MFTYPDTVWKESKYGVFSGPYFPIFGLNTEKYGPEKTPYLDTFHGAWGTSDTYLEPCQTVTIKISI